METGWLYLVCNAHLDPVWLWEWEEGVAETLSTFRTAAELCEEFEEFVFCHNEALLYQWVERYEPALFERIQRLVAQRRWHIMGGWYLQPDCNLPCGESLIRQVLWGKRYFQDKFGIEPRTAVNLDPFGHTRGLVQILRRSGYDSYLFCRPDAQALSLPAEDFRWVGYDGSQILAHRATEHYNSEKGQAAQRIRAWLENNSGKKSGILLWGIGDHGGGPSREDLRAIRKLASEDTDPRVRHGRPEEYFETLVPNMDAVPRWERSLNPWAVGCYTTMSRVKQVHRRLENALYLTEKMLAHAALERVLTYPHADLDTALQDLLFCEFHDILPGSAIAEVESYALQRMSHGLEMVERWQNRAFFALLSGQDPAAEGEFPIFVYNPHPFPLYQILACEFQPAEPNPDPESFWMPELRGDSGALLVSQLEKESSNIANDHRKRVVFPAILQPGRMHRFSCRLQKTDPPSSPIRGIHEDTVFSSERAELFINGVTGWIDGYRVDGHDYLRPDSCRLLVVRDYPDPWGMKVTGFRDVVGAFRLMTDAEAARLAGSRRAGLDPLRVIEDGPVRTVIEALFQHGSSSACLHYILPKKGAAVEVAVRIFWNEKDRMLKLSVPTPFVSGNCRGQVACGADSFPSSEDEMVAQQWLAVISEDRAHALSLINQTTYGFDFHAGELRPSLLRSAAYAAHPVDDHTPIVPDDRFIPRIDQGEREFRFWLTGGTAGERLSRVDREALALHQAPVVLCCSPPGSGKPLRSFVEIEDGAVLLTACKLAEGQDRLILRLFEPTGESRTARIKIPVLKQDFSVDLTGFELKTMAVDLRSGEAFAVDLLERLEQIEPEGDLV